MAIVTTDNKHYTNIAEAIRSKTNGEETYKPEQMVDGINKVYKAGKKAGNETFWKDISNNYTPTDWGYAFQYCDLANIDEPLQPIKSESVTRMFGYYKGKRIPNGFDFSSAWDVTHTFRYAEQLEVFQDMNMPNPKSGKGYPGTWQFCYNLETIEVVRCDENTIFDASFHSCRKLKNITFEGFIGQNISFEQSTVLSKDSIEGIINLLSPDVTDKTLTLSSAAVTSAYGSTDSSEWFNILSRKPNWTISLV